MGALCSSCFGSEEFRESYNTVRASSTGVKNTNTPDPEERRRQLAEAAEKRLQQQEARGIQNIDSVKRKEQRKAEMEKREQELETMGNTGGSGLTWQVN